MRFAALVATSFLLLLQSSASLGRTVHLLPYEGAITPITVEYLTEGIAAAEEAGAEAVIIELDTPGGLLASTHDIVKAELGAQVPVIVFVSPAGSRAASAGVWLTMAAHVAAMAPGTNIGSASPVNLGGASPDTSSTMSRKVMNDAIANLVSVAQQRGRSEEWARRFVQDAENLPAEEAVRENVVDLMATSLEDLLTQLDGRVVQLEAGPDTLATAGATLERREMGWRQRLLSVLVNPSVAYILMMLGVAGLYFELSNPGALFPGIIGGICLLLAFFALQSLPTNYAGAALMGLGLVLLILEIKVTSYGALTIGGLTAMVLGSLLLFDSAEKWAQLSLKVVLPAVLTFGGFFALCVLLVVRGQRRPVVTGLEAMVGETGRALAAMAASELGKVVIRGEIWDAVSAEPVPAGRRVEVVSIDGRTARVRPV